MFRAFGVFPEPQGAPGGPRRPQEAPRKAPGGLRRRTRKTPGKRPGGPLDQRKLETFAAKPPDYGKCKRFAVAPPDKGTFERFTAGPPDHGKRARFTVGPPDKRSKQGGTRLHQLLFQTTLSVFLSRQVSGWGGGSWRPFLGFFPGECFCVVYSRTT